MALQFKFKDDMSSELCVRGNLTTKVSFPKMAPRKDLWEAARDDMLVEAIAKLSS